MVDTSVLSRKFFEQRYEGKRIYYEPKVYIPIFFAIGLTCIFISMIMNTIYGASNVVEQSWEYDNSTEIEFFVGTDDTYYIYYQIDNMYQSHRRFARSRSDKQLHGMNITLEEAKQSCYPLYEAKEGEVLKPCGTFAWAFFTDKFSIEGEEIRKDGIAWYSDVNYKFRGGEENDLNISAYNDPDFVNWMRISPFEGFRKLYGIVDLKAGNKYRLNISSNYDAKEFDGKKHVIITNLSMFGGSNTFLIVTYFVFGVLVLILAGVLSYLYIKK